MIIIHMLRETIKRFVQGVNMKPTREAAGIDVIILKKNWGCILGH